MDKLANAHEALDALQDLFCQKATEMAPKVAEMKILEKGLKGIEDELQAGLDALYPAAEDGVRKTESWLLEYAAKGKATIIPDKKALVDALGLGLFIELAEVTMENLKKHLTVVQLSQLTKEINKNKRRLKYAPVSL